MLKVKLSSKKELDRICEDLRKIANGQKPDREYVLDFFDRLANRSLDLSRVPELDEESGDYFFMPEGVSRLISTRAA